MKLQDIYDQLSFGELSNVFLGKRNREDQGIEKEAFEKLLPLVQTGLTDLHTRMFLREDREPVTLEDDKATYVVAPTNKEVLQIEKIIATYNGEDFEVPLDDENDPAAIRRTGLSTFIVPDDEDKAPWLKETGDMIVVYRANHPPIKEAKANSAPLVTTIELPSSHLWALLLFVASRAHNPVGMKQEFHAGNNYAARYEAEVQRLKDLGMEIELANSNARFCATGLP